MKRFLQVFRWLFLLASLAGAIYIIAWSNILVVKSVEITGTQDTNAISLVLDSGKPPIRVGEPLARIDVKAIDKKLQSISWIEKSVISRQWLKRNLSIRITPRSAIASFLDTDGTTYFFDATGAVFSHRESSGSLPAVSLSHQSAELKTAVAHMLSQLTPDLITSATAFYARTTEDLEMRVGTGKGVLIKWGSADNFALKLRVFNKIQSLPENKSSILYDLSTPLAPIVK